MSAGKHPHLFQWTPLFCLCRPQEHCYQSLSSWKNESCAALSVPAHYLQGSCVIGWLLAEFAVTGSAAGKPQSPGSFLGWGLMRSWWGGGCWLGPVCNDSVITNRSAVSTTRESDTHTQTVLLMYTLTYHEDTLMDTLRYVKYV